MDSNEQDGNARGKSSRTPGVAGSSKSIGPESLATTTFARFLDFPIATSLLAGPRVRPSAVRAPDPGARTIGGSGPTWPGSFARYIHGTSSWKTSQACLSEAWGPYLVTWPVSGSMRNGSVYQRLPLELPISELGSSLWPTPVASETPRKTPYAQGGRSLAYMLGGMPSQPFLEWMMGFPARWCGDSGMP